MRNRLTNSLVPVTSARDAVLLARRSQLLLARRPSGPAGFWLGLNRANSLAAASAESAEQDRYAMLVEARALVDGALDRAERERMSAARQEDVLVVTLEVARALEQSAIGREGGASGGAIDALLERGARMLPPHPRAPHPLASRLSWIRAERGISRLFDDVTATSGLGVVDLLEQRVPRLSDALGHAEESLRLATEQQRPDAAFLVLATLLFLAQAHESPAVWEALLHRTAELRAVAGNGGAGQVGRIESEAELGRARTEADPRRRAELLTWAEQRITARLLAAGPDDLSWHLRYLGRLMLVRFHDGGDPASADAGIEKLAMAVPAAANVLDRITAAMLIGTELTEALDAPIAVSRDRTDRWRCRAATAIDEALADVRRQAALGAVRSERQSSVSIVGDLPLTVAELWVAAKHPDRAVLSAEQARLVGLSAALDAERLDQALVAHGEKLLAERRRALALRLADLESALAGPAPGGSPGKSADKARAVREELGRLTDHARRLTGTASTLDVDWQAVVAAARSAPLVYLLPGQVEGSAVLVHGNGLTGVVPLPEFAVTPQDGRSLWEVLNTYERASAGLARGGTGRWQRTLQSTIDWLERVLAPLKGEMAGLREVVVVVCGEAARLPVHAVLAGPVVRYAPGIRALREASPLARRSMLSVSVERSAHRPQQPLRTADVLADRACLAFAGSVPPPRRLREARRDELLRELPGAAVVHFSCHGVADDTEVLAGGLELADARLTVADVLRLRLPEARLAVVAACESGQPGLRLPDEQNSLATGLVEAGFSGVIATLWEVEERPAFYLLSHFYRLLADDPLLHPAAALTQAQRWLRTATQEQLDDHPCPGEPPRFTSTATPSPRYAHPDAWAGFAYFGT